MKRINIHLKEDTIKVLQAIADEKEASLAYVVRQAVKEYLGKEKKS